MPASNPELMSADWESLNPSLSKKTRAALSKNPYVGNIPTRQKAKLFVARPRTTCRLGHLGRSRAPQTLALRFALVTGTQPGRKKQRERERKRDSESWYFLDSAKVWFSFEGAGLGSRREFTVQHGKALAGFRLRLVESWRS